MQTNPVILRRASPLSVILRGALAESQDLLSEAGTLARSCDYTRLARYAQDDETKVTRHDDQDQ